MMKRKLTLLALLLVASSRIFACDICGCGVGNYYIGALPQFDDRFVGIRYNYSHFMTRMSEDATEFSKDFYQTIEVWGGMKLGDKIQLFALLPYNVNHQVSDDGITDRNGIGDILLLANYKLLDLRPGKQNAAKITQEFWVGGGVKLATGKFNIEENEPDVAAIANGQPGSGSTDFLLNTMYNLHIRKLGVSVNANYKINSANNNFKFGNKISASSFGYYTLNASAVTITPNIGVLYAHTASNRLQGSKINLTGGYVLTGSAGVEIGINRITIGVNSELPLAQNFAENQTSLKNKSTLHVSFAF